MKKLIYILAMLSLPVVVFSQYQPASYPTDGTFNDKVVQIAGNPGNGQFNVLFARNHDIYKSVIAYDNTGRMVFQKQHLNGNPVQIDLSQLQAGIYFLVFMADNRMDRLTERVAIVK